MRETTPSPLEKIKENVDAERPATSETPPPVELGEQLAEKKISYAEGAEVPGMKWVLGGTFTMGQDKGGEQDEHPAHQVTLHGFYLDTTEVTHQAYELCVSKKICREADRKLLNKYGGQFHAPLKPVMGVSAFDAETYCTWVKKRLPTEAEFERAVRGDDGRMYPWGNSPPTSEKTVYHTNTTSEVGTHPLGRGPYGHDDLAGNVWEWTHDLYDPLAYTREGASQGIPGNCTQIMETLISLKRRGQQGFTGSNPIPSECERAIRGGAYNYDAHGLRSTNRVHHPGNFRLLMTGFRCAKDAGS